MNKSLEKPSFFLGDHVCMCAKKMRKKKRIERKGELEIIESKGESIQHIEI